MTHRTWRKVRRRWMPLGLAASGALVLLSSAWLVHSLSVPSEIRDLADDCERRFREKR